MFRIALLAAAAVVVAGFADAAPKKVVSHSAAVGPPLPPIEKAMVAAQVDYQQKQSDPYAADFPIGVPEGFAFKIDKPVDQEVSDAGAYYDDGTLHIGLHEIGYVVALTGYTKNGRSYIGSNAYGAKARVTTLYRYAFGLKLESAPDSDPDRQGSRDYRFEKTLPGPAAKALKDHAHIVVEGTVAKLENGKVAGCATNSSGATIDDPTDWTELRCFVGANVTRIAFVNEATGEVLKEWKKQ